MKQTPRYAIADLTGGLNTRQRANKIAPNQLQSIIGMDFNANSLRRALGYEKFGEDVDEDTLGKTLYTHSILAGQEVMIKTIGQYLKYYDEVSGNWYKLTDATFTAETRWSFDKFNGYLYGNNGVDDWIFWQGSTLTTIELAITAVDTEIELPSGKGNLYPNSGTVMIEDEAIPYTGKSGDTLTGCTITADHAAGVSVLLRLDSTTYSGLQKAEQVAFFRNRLYLIDKDTPTIIRHSKLADNTNPETDLVDFTINGAISGDAGFGIAPDQILAIQTIINGNSASVLAAFCRDGIVYAFVVTDGTGTTTNTFVPMRTMTTYPLTKELVTVVENDISINDQYGHVRTLGFGDVNNPLQVQTISQQIEPSLEVTDFSDGASIYNKRKFYTIGKTEEAQTNDIVYYHDTNYTAWGSYKHWDCLDFTLYNGQLYGLSTISGKVWKLNTGYDADGGTYYSEAVTKDIEFGSPLTLKEMGKARISGLITRNCIAYIDFFFDNSETPVTFEISGDNAQIVVNEPNVAVGTVVFGSGVFGGGLPNGTDRREFYAEMIFSSRPQFNKFAMKIRVDDQNVDFEMNDCLFWAKPLDANAWLTQKTINPS